MEYVHQLYYFQVTCNSSTFGIFKHTQMQSTITAWIFFKKQRKRKHSHDTIWYLKWQCKPRKRGILQIWWNMLCNQLAFHLFFEVPPTLVFHFLLIIGVLVYGFETGAIFIHAMFGAFQFGLTIHRDSHS